MSTKSSPQKSGIPSLDEYYLALELYTEALDRINSGGTGMGYSGIHYIVMERVRRFGGFANGREDAVRVLGKMLREFEQEHNLTTSQTDEDYLSKFDDL